MMSHCVRRVCIQPDLIRLVQGSIATKAWYKTRYWVIVQLLSFVYINQKATLAQSSFLLFIAPILGVRQVLATSHLSICAT